MIARCALATLLLVAGIGSLALTGPPAGRPPTNALKRVEPEMYDVKFEVTLLTEAHPADQAQYGLFNFDEAPIVFPVIYMGPYSRVFPDSEDGYVFVDARPVQVTRATDDGKPFNTHLLRMVAPTVRNARSVRFRFTFRTQSWSALIHEQRAQQSTWPRNLEWPEEVRDGLKHQKFIESNEKVFEQMLAKEFGDKLRLSSPYIAAKVIVRSVLQNFQVSGADESKGFHGEIRGMNVNGALATVTNPDPVGRWVGTEHDLVCVCVAFLRAAGIPARPVIGIEEELDESDLRERERFVSWVEFYLPESGWVSIDPVAMIKRGSAQYRNLTAPWPDFGTMEELNERIALSYFFLPPAGDIEVPGWPAVWGWDPRPQPRQPSYRQAINMDINSRGKGIEDPG